MTRHAELGASRAERWMHCPGSVRMSRAVPDVDTPYAAEGRQAHALAERLLNNLSEYSVGSYPSGTDPEMLAHVRVYVDYVIALANGKQLAVEVTFNLASLQGADAEPMYGTADAVVIGGRRLDVVDLKYGAGVPVEVNGNVQLLYYVIGALVSHAAGRTAPYGLLEVALTDFDDIWVHIVQPRAPHADGPIRTAHVSHDEVRAFAAELMVKAAETQNPNAPLHAGTWCKFCPAQAFCPEVKRYAIEVAQRDFTVVEPPPVETLPIELVGSILSKLDVLEHWAAALKARAQAELEAGRPVPGWKLVTKRPRRVWNKAEDVVTWIRSTFGDLSPWQESVLKSPAQIEDLVGKKNLPPELYSLVSSGTTLVPQHDRRPALTKGPAEDFTALPTTQSGGDAT